MSEKCDYPNCNKDREKTPYCEEHEEWALITVNNEIARRIAKKVGAKITKDGATSWYETIEKILDYIDNKLN